MTGAVQSERVQGKKPFLPESRVGRMIAGVVVAAFVLYSLALLVALLWKPDHRRIATKTAINRIYLALRIIEADLEMPIEQLVTTKVVPWDSSVTLDERVMLLLRIRGMGTREVDLWGRRFNIELIDVDESIVNQASGRALFERIRIWSSGANGKDESRGGDDIELDEPTKGLER